MTGNVEGFADSRWMPPSPHREAILEWLKRGRAHIEERGHGQPPLFISEDGGALELPLVRIVDGKLMAADRAAEAATTKHVDVCGTIDELERLWAEQPDAADWRPEEQEELLADVLRMLRRMKQRVEAYRQFAQAVGRCVEEMEALEIPDHQPAPDLAAELRAIIRAGSQAVRERHEELVAQAEALRKIAGDTEQVLYRCRDLAIEIGRLYEEIRGGRQWKPKEKETG